MATIWRNLLISIANGFADIVNSRCLIFIYERLAHFAAAFKWMIVMRIDDYHLSCLFYDNGNEIISEPARTPPAAERAACRK